jgi:hypothetical protein
MSCDFLSDGLGAISSVCKLACSNCDLATDHAQIQHLEQEMQAKELKSRAISKSAGGSAGSLLFRGGPLPNVRM